MLNNRPRKADSEFPDGGDSSAAKEAAKRISAALKRHGGKLSTPTSDSAEESPGVQKEVSSLAPSTGQGTVQNGKPKRSVKKISTAKGISPEKQEMKAGKRSIARRSHVSVASAAASAQRERVFTFEPLTPHGTRTCPQSQ